jgi:phytanoyl-CoA hydroxylase
MQKNSEQNIREDFERDGYVFLPGFLSRDEVALINKKLTALIQGTVSKMHPEHVFYEDKKDESTLKQLQDLNVYDPFFEKMLTGSRFEEVAKELLDEDVVGKTIEYFNKPPKIGKATPPHQDGYYFMLKPSSAVTMWLALEDVDEENGCVRYIKGSHLTGMRPHGRTQTLGFSQGITDYADKDVSNEIYFPAKPGDLLVHHSMTIHTAGANKSASRTRKALGFIYFAQSAQPDTVALEAYRKKLNEERKIETAERLK